VSTLLHGHISDERIRAAVVSLRVSSANLVVALFYGIVSFLAIKINVSMAILISLSLLSFLIFVVLLKLGSPSSAAKPRSNL
jgi:hypothetical protein